MVGWSIGEGGTAVGGRNSSVLAVFRRGGIKTTVSSAYDVVD